jgi:hypothetical protein
MQQAEIHHDMRTHIRVKEERVVLSSLVECVMYGVLSACCSSNLTKHAGYNSFCV